MMITPYLRLVRIVRISPKLSLKEVIPQRISGLKEKIARLKSDLEKSAEMTEELQRLAEEKRCHDELALTADALAIAERAFPDILLVLTVHNISLFDERIPVTSRLVPIDGLYGIDYFDPFLLAALRKDKVFEKSITNVYKYNEEIGTYEDLNCGGIYQTQTVYSFRYKETPRSADEEKKFVRRSAPGSEEPIYYPILESGHVGVLRDDYVIDNPQYTFVRFSDEVLPNAGSILCAREVSSDGEIAYYGVKIDGTKGQKINFPGGEEIREKLRTPYNEGQVL